MINLGRILIASARVVQEDVRGWIDYSCRSVAWFRLDSKAEAVELRQWIYRFIRAIMKSDVLKQIQTNRITQNPTPRYSWRKAPHPGIRDVTLRVMEKWKGLVFEGRISSFGECHPIPTIF